MVCLLVGVTTALPQEYAPTQTAPGTRPLRSIAADRVATILPSDIHPLLTASAMEDFLNRLDGGPPDWPKIYGAGHQDPGHDDRLFELNRKRDAARVGNPALDRRIAFVWQGELTHYDQKAGGFTVGIGPTLTPTRWGVVRFKPEDLPGNLIAVPNPQLRQRLRRQFDHGRRIEISVLMTGRLVQEESLVYDFSHDQEGQGMIIPVVRVERVDLVLHP